MPYFNIYRWLDNNKANPLFLIVSKLVTRYIANKYREQFNTSYDVRFPLKRSPSAIYLVGAEGNTDFMKGLLTLAGIIHGSFGFVGTCGLVHSMPGLIEKICFLAGAQRAYVTIGCVHDVIEGITLFEGAPRGPSVTGEQLRLQGDYHAWITLDSGEIIDLTFASSLIASENEFRPLFGVPFQLGRFVYEPYMILDVFPADGVDDGIIALIRQSLSSPGWEEVMRGKLWDYLEEIRITAPDVFAHVQKSFRARFPQYGNGSN